MACLDKFSGKSCFLQINNFLKSGNYVNEIVHKIFHDTMKIGPKEFKNSF